MKSSVFWIILIVVYLIFVSIRHIINIILSTGIVKKKIAEELNQSIKMIDLSNTNINPGFMTTLYDLKLYVNDFKADDFSIYFDSLNRIVLNVTKCTGNFKFKFYTGPYYYVSIGSKITVEVDNIYLNYAIDVKSYYPLKLAYNNFNYKIVYNVGSDKMIQQYLIGKGLNYYKDSINELLTNFLKDLPNMIPIWLKDIIEDYQKILKIIQNFTKIHSKYSPL